MESSKCPKCGEEPQFVEHMSKWYCYGCNTYIDEEPHECAAAPEENEDAPRSVCKNCGAELQGLKDGMLFCFVCETYPDEISAETEHVENDAQSLVDSAATPPEQKPEPSTPVIEAKPEKAPEVVQPTVAPTEEVAPSLKPIPEPVATAPAAQSPSPKPESKKEEPNHVKMCPSCGHAMKFIDKYQRHYCYGCRKYAPKDQAKYKGPVEKRKCPGCSGDLRYIEKYNEWYCYSCKSYPLRKKALAAPKEAEALSCPKCHEPVKFIEKYGRHYCYKCKEYAPKGFGSGAGGSEIKKCPTCSKDMKYVAEYDEWYCYSCRKYSLRPSKPLLL